MSSQYQLQNIRYQQQKQGKNPKNNNITHPTIPTNMNKQYQLNKQQPLQTSTIINSNKLISMVDKLKLTMFGTDMPDITTRYRSVQIEDRSARSGGRLRSYRCRNRTIEGQDSRTSDKEKYQPYSSVCLNKSKNTQNSNRNKQQHISNNNKQTINTELRTYRYKNKLGNKNKVNSARQLYCRDFTGKLSVGRDRTASGQPTKTSNRQSITSKPSSNNSIKNKPKKTRRYLTQIPTTTHPNHNNQIIQIAQPTKLQMNPPAYAKQLRQTPLRQQLEQISEIMEETKNITGNYRDQLSILDNIGELDTILAKLQGRQSSKTKVDGETLEMEKRFKKKKNNSIKKPKPIEPCLQNSQHQTNKQNNHIQSVPTLPSLQYQTILTIPTLQNQPNSEIYTHRPINIYENRNKKARNKLKQLKNNTLIMRSIDKIKHNFPKGFFYDTINQLQ